MGESLLMCIVLLLLFNIAAPLISLTTTSSAAAHGAAINSSFLPLSPGLNLRISASYNLTSGDPLSLDLMFTVATPTLDAEGLFIPILSSPSFNTSPSSSSGRPPFGYSLGFYLKPSSILYQTFVTGYDLYMAVCAGSLGSANNNTGQVGLYTMNESIRIAPYRTVDGFAAPVWIANPRRYADQASLILQLVSDNSTGGSTHHVLELQLRDGEKVVWTARNIGAIANILEMQDTGHLNLIDNSTNTAHLVSVEGASQ